MAKVSKRVEIKETITLELTREEAQAVVTFYNSIGGGIPQRH